MTKTEAYAAAIYARMEEEANDENLWEGKITEIVKELNVPMGGYNRPMNFLRKLGCIELIERGSGIGERNSLVRLIKPPTPELWQADHVKSRDSTLTRGPSLDILRQEVRDMQKLLGGMNVISVLANFEERISTLERFVQQQTATQHTASPHTNTTHTE